jgi:hypothetical protein
MLYALLANPLSQTIRLEKVHVLCANSISIHKGQGQRRHKKPRHSHHLSTWSSNTLTKVFNNVDCLMAAVKNCQFVKIKCSNLAHNKKQL